MATRTRNTILTDTILQLTRQGVSWAQAFEAATVAFNSKAVTVKDFDEQIVCDHLNYAEKAPLRMCLDCGHIAPIVIF